LERIFETCDSLERLEVKLKSLEVCGTFLDDRENLEKFEKRSFPSEYFNRSNNEYFIS
jgi:hypothetical protein